MNIGQFQGISGVSKIIRFITRSCYSHSAFVMDSFSADVAEHVARDHADFAKLIPYRHPGAVIEAWEPNGVRNTPGISFGHERGTRVDLFSFRTPLTYDEEYKLLLSLTPEIGVDYDVKNVLRFVTKRPGNLDNTWFCSELVFQKVGEIGREMLAETQAWEVPPAWIPRSTQIRRDRSVVADSSLVTGVRRYDSVPHRPDKMYED